MKRFSILFILVLTISLTSFSQTKEDSSQKSNTDKNVEVYYFHYNHRCATCVAVEEESIKSIKELYPAKWKAKEITFLSIDMDSNDGEEFAKSMKIASQSLVITYNNEQKDLTNIAFLYARTKPEKLKKKIKRTIDKFLK